MDSAYIETKITEYIAQNSGLDQNRNYLGISKISGCPRQVYREYFDGVSLSEEAHRMCFTGYEQEREILHMLAGMGIAVILPENKKEVVAPFDERLRGHIDSVTVNGDLIEVKSVSVRKFEDIKTKNRPVYKNFIQVQLYMLYGGWRRTFVIYRCRETYEHFVLEIKFADAQARKFEQKAKRILGHIDEKVLPECECGRCE